jgi:peptidoglycan hydrolase-like protein with peptidoglycan-binding domain
MLKTRNVQLLLLFGVVGALPACSGMMGNRASGSASSSAAAAPQPVANDMVRQVQGRLQQDGYYKQGNVDGVWGTGTMNAVQAFQRDHNLSASGKLDVPTLQALNITDSGNNPAPTNPNPSTDARPYNTTPSTAPASNNPNRQP